MAELEPLGILGLEGVHYYVRDLERSTRFYVDRMDFDEIAESGATLTEGGHQRSRAFRAGDYVVVCSTPEGEGGRADRFLKKHPDGVGTLAFRVRDAQRAFTLLDGRGATPISDIETHRDEGGTLKTFSITTPFGDTTFRFVERHGMPVFSPVSARCRAPGVDRMRARSWASTTSRPTFKPCHPPCSGWNTCSAFSAIGTSSSTPATSGA